MNHVFVYGTLRHDQPNWEWALKNQGKLLGYALCPGELYTLGGFPGLILPTTDDRALGSTVVGEVYEVDDRTLERLDRLEGTAHGMYNRRTVHVEYINILANVPVDDEPPTMVNVYEYGRIPDRNKLIQSGDWVQYLSEKSK